MFGSLAAEIAHTHKNSRLAGWLAGWLISWLLRAYHKKTAGWLSRIKKSTPKRKQNISTTQLKPSPSSQS
eukprot:10303174-Alexandrium_andersonii.AAC.1